MNRTEFAAKSAALSGLIDRLELLSDRAREAYRSGDQRLFVVWMSEYGSTWESARHDLGLIGEAALADVEDQELDFVGVPSDLVFDQLTQRMAVHTNEFNEFMASINRENPEFLRPSPTRAQGQANGGACYVATAVYGSYEAPEVQVLRRFRDDELRKSALGRTFIRMYYKVSPRFACHLENAPMINKFVRRFLDVILARLEGRS